MSAPAVQRAQKVPTSFQTTIKNAVEKSKTGHLTGHKVVAYSISGAFSGAFAIAAVVAAIFAAYVVAAICAAAAVAFLISAIVATRIKVSKDYSDKADNAAKFAKENEVLKKTLAEGQKTINVDPNTTVELNKQMEELKNENERLKEQNQTTAKEKAELQEEHDNIKNEIAALRQNSRVDVELTPRGPASDTPITLPSAPGQLKETSQDGKPVETEKEVKPDNKSGGSGFGKIQGWFKKGGSRSGEPEPSIEKDSAPGAGKIASLDSQIAAKRQTVYIDRHSAIQKILKEFNKKFVPKLHKTSKEDFGNFIGTLQELNDTELTSRQTNNSQTTTIPNLADEGALEQQIKQLEELLSNIKKEVTRESDSIKNQMSTIITDFMQSYSTKTKNIQVDTDALTPWMQKLSDVIRSKSS